MWTDDLADALGVDRLSEAEVNTLLDTARDIAHRVERKDTPVSTYLLGVAVAKGLPLDEACTKVAALLPAEA
jgi:hypothetical protein